MLMIRPDHDDCYERLAGHAFALLESQVLYRDHDSV